MGWEGHSVRVRGTIGNLRILRIWEKVKMQGTVDECGGEALQWPEKGLEGAHRQRGGPQGATESPL